MAVNPPDVEPNEGCQCPHSTGNDMLLHPKRSTSDLSDEARLPLPTRIPYTIYRPYLDNYSGPLDLRVHHRSHSLSPTSNCAESMMKPIEFDSDYSSSDGDHDEKVYYEKHSSTMFAHKKDQNREKIMSPKHKMATLIEQPKRTKKQSDASAKRLISANKPPVMHRRHSAENDLLHQDEELARHLQHLEYMAARPCRRQMAELANTRLVEQFCSSSLPKTHMGKAHESKIELRKPFSWASDENKPKIELKDDCKEEKDKISAIQKRSKNVKKERKRMCTMIDAGSSSEVSDPEANEKANDSSSSKSSSKKSLYHELEQKYRKQNFSFYESYKMNARYREFFRDANGKMCVNEICEAFYHYIAEKDLIFKHNDGQLYIRFDDKLCDLFEHSHTPCEFRMTEVGRILITVHMEYQKGNLLAPLSDLLPSTSAQNIKQKVFLSSKM